MIAIHFCYRCAYEYFLGLALEEISLADVSIQKCVLCEHKEATIDHKSIIRARRFADELLHQIDKKKV